MKLASIEKITAKSVHPNAEALEFAHILGYKCIVRIADKFQVGEDVLFIFPDTVLPDVSWAAVFKAKSSRVKAIKLRGEWSEGIVMRPQEVGLPTGSLGEVSHLLGITKYEAPEPQDLQAKGNMPFGLPLTDEERWENLESIPFGKKVDVTLKKDGKSWTGYAIKDRSEVWNVGICGRRLEYKLDCHNHYTAFKSVLDKIAAFAQEQNVSIAFRGEVCGAGIQAFKGNPLAQGPVNLAIFSVYLVEERKYASITHPYYYDDICKIMGIPTVPMLEKGVVLTPELIQKYSVGLTELNGLPFEGVVIKGDEFSFKVINKHYDSRK